MYLSARSWGIQPSEFWEMTFVEWLLEAYDRWRNSPDGQRRLKIRTWQEDAELTVEEWNAKYGIAQNKN